MASKPQIFVCTNLRMSGGSCAGQGSHAVLKTLRTHDAVKRGDVEVRESVCLGYCGEGPNVKIMGGNFHHGVAPEGADRLVEEALTVFAADAAQGRGSV